MPPYITEAMLEDARNEANRCHHKNWTNSGPCKEGAHSICPWTRRSLDGIEHDRLACVRCHYSYCITRGLQDIQLGHVYTLDVDCDLNTPETILALVWKDEGLENYTHKEQGFGHYASEPLNGTWRFDFKLERVSGDRIENYKKTMAWAKSPEIGGIGILPAQAMEPFRRSFPLGRKLGGITFSGSVWKEKPDGKSLRGVGLTSCDRLVRDLYMDYRLWRQWIFPIVVRQTRLATNTGAPMAGVDSY